MRARDYTLDTGQLIQLKIDGEVWYDTEILDLMSSQFTCLVNGKVRFFFYADRGDTWQLMKNE